MSMSTSTQILVENTSRNAFEELPEVTCVEVRLIQCHRSDDEIYGVAVIEGFPPQDVVNEISYSVRKSYFHAYYLDEEEETGRTVDQLELKLSIQDISTLDEDDLRRIIRYASI